ncbi:MAG: hypothetical protein ABSH48_14505 [Verrucomicrobiota bacterium]|jgi:hypothetical protein
MNFSATPAGTHRRRQSRNWRAGWLAGFFALASVEAAPPWLGVFHRDYRPNNVFAYPAKLSLDFRRVAVLPIAASSSDGDLSDGCRALAPILFEQLVKTKRFEVVTVEPDSLRHGTGQRSWTGAETLPADFLGFLRREYGCDGVLFAELTSYHAYAPLAVGWRFKLVDAHSGQILWAADEVIDAAQPAVQHAAQHIDGKHDLWPFGRDQNWLALNSPRQFGCYSVATLLATLPER